MSAEVATPSFCPEEVKIGTQIWMAKNYDFGGPDGSSAFPGGEEGNITDYGRLYTWTEACAINLPGWHLPTMTEFATLVLYVSSDGGALKETGTDHWDSPNTGATNSTGFTVRGAGNDGSNLGEYAYFWSSTEYNEERGNCLGLYYNNTNAYYNLNALKTNRYSVRLIKDYFYKWTNSDWDTFTSDGVNVSSAIEGAGTSGTADSNTIYLLNGTKITFTYNLTLNSGSYPDNAPQIHLYRIGTGIEDTYNINPSFNGIPFTIEANYSDYYKLQFKNTSTNACDCSCTFTISF